MATSAVPKSVGTAGRSRGVWAQFLFNVWTYRYLYLMLVLPFVFFIIFRFYPMWGNIIAFKKYQLMHGIWGSQWVGLKHFNTLFDDPAFLRVLRNTVSIAVFKMIFAFPAPIILALFVNEVRHMAYKRFVQTVVYVPHFLSWVIYGAILYIVLSPANGIVNNIISSLGMEKVAFFQKPGYFQPIVIISSLLKETGWAAIIYLATISTIDLTLYEAAIIDGANRWQLMRYVTLPGLAMTIVTLFILQIGFFLNVGFEQIFILQNNMVLTTADVIETFIYRVGIRQARFDFTTAAGLFNGLVGMVLVLLADRLAKRLDLPGIF